MLKLELEKSNVAINNLETKAVFYRRQLVLESRFGMILQRSFYKVYVALAAHSK